MTTGTGAADVDFTRVSALAVEDDAGGMAIMGVMMRYLGIRGFLNTTGEGVVELARAMKPRPDIIFLSLNLPRANSYDILSQIRADHKLRRVRVVAVTDGDGRDEIARCMAAGFDGFIAKPISRSRFPRQVRRILMGEPVWELD